MAHSTTVVVLCAATCLFALPVGGVRAQDRAPDPSLARSLGLDFAVPESPAFNLLAVEPGALLRPTSVKEFTTGISGLVGDGTAISFPRQFGIEFAPALLLAGSRLSLRQYRNGRTLYRLRLSGAMSRPESGATSTKLAVGIRVSLLDKSDPRMNQAYLGELERFHLNRARTATAVADSIRALGALPPDRLPPEADDLVVAYVQGGGARADSVLSAWGVTGGDRAALQSLLARMLAGTVERSELEAVRNEFEDATWNAAVFDLAVAALAVAGNDSGVDVGVQEWAGWGTLGLPLGRTGQALFGLKAAIQRDTVTGDWDPSGTFSSRIYFGNNEIKLLLEAQGTFRDDASPLWLASSGGEFRTPIGPWVRFTAGVEWDRELDRNRLVSSVALGLGLPGLFR